ncbi:MAG TPA: ferrochelatase [Candidatus Dormibacteraeota bacterium]|nr:ferrochelatase [Candidatus Dormibacteraeota bacterium]
MTATSPSGRADNSGPTAPGAGGLAVLLMAYGSPRSDAEILPYYTHMRGGRPPAAEALVELQRRYQAIGGSSPLQEITRAQAEALQEELRRRQSGDWRVVVGMKHSPPFLEDAVRQLADDGVKSAVGLVLAPHYSRLSIGEYVERARAALPEDAELQLRFVTDWHLDRGYVAWLAARVSEKLAEVPQSTSRRTLVIFTAHSLPARLRDMGDPYPDQLGETAAAAARAAGLENWTTAWQSVAKTGEPWLGPELLEVVAEAARTGTTNFVVCPCGFTADHLEILYDLDVEAQAEAGRIGVRIARTPMPNARADFVTILANLVETEIAPSL